MLYFIAVCNTSSSCIPAWLPHFTNVAGIQLSQELAAARVPLSSCSSSSTYTTTTHTTTTTTTIIIIIIKIIIIFFYPGYQGSRGIWEK